jgi:group I intron endonuclease
MDRISGVYAISSKCKPDRIYVGSSVNIEKRWGQHRHELKNGKHRNHRLQNHCNKYGIEDLIYRFLIPCEDGSLVVAEQAFIDFYRPYFNILPKAGSTFGYKHTEEARIKMSLALIGNTHTLGKSLSEEHRAKLSMAATGIHRSHETKEKMSEALRGNKRALGYKHTEETRKKMGVWQEGKVLTEETKEKIGEAAKGNKRWLGKHHSPDTKEKLRAANVGKHASEETRRKMGEAQKKRQANKRLKMVSL